MPRSLASRWSEATAKIIGRRFRFDLDTVDGHAILIGFQLVGRRDVFPVNEQKAVRNGFVDRSIDGARESVEAARRTVAARKSISFAARPVHWRMKVSFTSPFVPRPRFLGESRTTCNNEAQGR